MKVCLHPEEQGCFLLPDSQRAQHDTAQVNASPMIYGKSTYMLSYIGWSVKMVRVKVLRKQ